MSLINSIRPSLIQLPSPTGTGFGEEWSIKLQSGLTYHMVELETNLVNVETIKKNHHRHWWCAGCFSD
ncbi:major capsid protein P2 [Pseudoalteromonas phenolica]|uniref:major capsid protein P2 n=1 Tax=Pseudoalteromonas phenolica TaxID=161398 RepID=UPI000FFF1D62|nr:major capsid protein P2 [Pseudoalteromonas phenolica]RXE92570.1 hypothetical protein D9981_21465 [Pseudoalteromonas phenolica O-BC30]